MTNQLPTKQKGRKATKFRGANCLNCNTPLDLSDVYCSYCGQLNTTKSLSLKDFFGEFIGSIITYDSRFRYTLKDLLFRPGTITRNYVDGQRLKYANPFRFFLSVSIIYFLINSIITSFTSDGTLFKINNTSSNDPKEQIITAIDSLDLTKVIDSTSVIIDSVPVPVNELLEKHGLTNDFTDKKMLDSILKESIDKVQKKDTVQTYKYISEDSLQKKNWANRTIARLNLYRDFYKTTKILSPEEALDSLKHPASRSNKWAYSKVEAMEQIEKKPADFVSYLIEKTPFFVFFFTPFYAVFFWLIYSKKKYTYMEHMIFIFHIFSFVFLGMLIALIPDVLIGQEIIAAILFMLIGPFYFYKALRNFYKQNRFITIIKFIFLNFVFGISATISAILFFAVTAAMY